MRTYDLTPLYRQSVGFDTLNRLVESALKWDEAAPSYPPYNIEKISEDDYRITLAVAGFGADDITITAQENALIIAGKLAKDDEAQTNFLHRGIAGRAFERRFQLADHVKVTKAQMENGLLHINLVREVPEAAKPRTIKVELTEGTKTLNQQAA